jgi:transcriptional regulator with XRE-family HTH domain
MRSLQPVPYGSLLARNLRAARAAANLSQNDVGERMQALGFGAWLRSTVSLAEQGKRRVTAEELLGLSLVVGTSMVRLAEPHEESPWIELPCGKPVHRSAVRGAGEVQWAGTSRFSCGMSAGCTPCRRTRTADRASPPFTGGRLSLAVHD